jgi:hypothetical protein
MGTVPPILNLRTRWDVLGPSHLTAVPTALVVMWDMNLAVFKKKKSLALLGTDP